MNLGKRKKEKANKGEEGYSSGLSCKHKRELADLRRGIIIGEPEYAVVW